jgi:hypothetical protein
MSIKALEMVEKELDYYKNRLEEFKKSGDKELIQFYTGCLMSLDSLKKKIEFENDWELTELEKSSNKLNEALK